MTVKGSSCLVVGADGLLGASLIRQLVKGGATVTGTTRHRSMARAGDRRLYLDLADVDHEQISPLGYEVAILCAARTGMAACEADPLLTRQVNVINTVALAKSLLASRTRIIFLSSSTIFDGSIAWPDEGSPYSPTCEYGRQKAEAEQRLASLSTAATPVAIVRLSKVLAAHTGTAAEFLRRLLAGENCQAFDDLKVCPISLDYATQAVLRVTQSGRHGIFHLSGEENMSYANFARQLAIFIGADPQHVRACASPATLFGGLLRPSFPGLGMQRTRALLGIEPESTDHLLAALAPPS